MTNIILVAPPHRHNSAGVQVLYRLCHQLNVAGYSAYITGHSVEHPHAKPWSGKLNEDDIVVYPDCVPKNILNAKKVVRYMLYYPSAHCKTRIPTNELLIPYDKYILRDCASWYNGEVRAEDCLPISVIEPWLFYRTPAEAKTLISYYVSKGGDRYREFNLPKEAIQITGNMTRAEVASILRQSKEVYVFDVNSAVLHEASICGADVYAITEALRVLPYRGPTEEENKHDYDDLDRIHRFAKRVLEFDYQV